MRLLSLLALMAVGIGTLLAQKPNLKDYASIMEEEGYGSIEMEKADNYIRFKAAGETVILFLDEDLDFQLYAGYIAEDQPDCGIVNLWNRDHRFFRAYIDDEGDYALEYDHIVSENITEDEISMQLNFFVQALGEYQRAIYSP
jgi:hypothetical protein